MSRNAETIAWYRRLKENSKCVVCGFDHPAAIEFHHVNADEKHDTIGNMVRNGCSITEIQKELELCRPLCSNHHKIVHWEQRYGKPDNGQLKIDFYG